MKIKEHEIETKEERRWFSIIKEKSREVKYGCLEFKAIIKNGKIVSLQGIREVESFNIDRND